MPEPGMAIGLLRACGIVRGRRAGIQCSYEELYGAYGDHRRVPRRRKLAHRLQQNGAP